jgi:hypothetical protein
VLLTPTSRPPASGAVVSAAGGARDFSALDGQPAVVRPVSQFAEHPPSGHRHLVKSGAIGRAGEGQGRADDSDGLPGADVRFSWNVHLTPETPKWH